MCGEAALDQDEAREMLAQRPVGFIYGVGPASQEKLVQRGYRRPPSFHIDRLRQAPAGHFFDVITNGFGAMPDYRQQVPARDRWAIIAYIRALQASTAAGLGDVPEPRRGEIKEPGR